MIKLFKFEGYKLTVEPEAILLKPFRKIWNRDRSQYKETAMLELGYIYFMCDPRSDYQYHTDESERSEKIIEGEGFKEGWKPDILVKEAIDFYSTFKPTASLLLEDTRLAVDKLRTLLRDIDLTQTDDKGKPIYTLNTVVSTIKQVPELVKALDEAEKSLASEIKSATRMRGSGEKTISEDGFDGLLSE